MDRVICLAMMVLAVAFLGCTKDTNGVPQTGACSVLGLGERIVNGTACQERNSPVVELTILLDDGNIATCSGSLLTSTKVLTAAHCLASQDDKVTITSVSARVSGRDINVSARVVHPAYLFPQNDIGIATLAEAVAAQTLPIVMSRSVAAEDIISIFGYGVDDENNSGALRSGQMKITGVNSQSITARFLEDDGSAICFGDSGGPAVFEFENARGDARVGIVGVTSYTSEKNKCEIGGLSGFLNVQGSSASDFIFAQVPDAGSV